MMGDQNPPQRQEWSDAPLEVPRSSCLPTAPGGDVNSVTRQDGNGAAEEGGSTSDQADVAAVMRLLQETLPRLSGSYNPSQPPSSTTMPPPPPPQVSTSTPTPMTSLLMAGNPSFPLLTADSITRDSPYQSSPTISAFPSMYPTTTTPAPTTILSNGPSPVLPHCQPFSQVPKQAFSPSLTQPRNQFFTQPPNQIFTHPSTQVFIQPSPQDFQASLQGFSQSSPQTLIRGFTQTPHILPHGFPHSPTQACRVGLLHTSPQTSPGLPSMGCHQRFHGSYPAVEKSPLLQASNRSTLAGVVASPGYGTAGVPSDGSGTAHHQDSEEDSTRRGSRYFRFSRKQLLSLASMLMVDFFAFASISIMAPFFPHQAMKLGVSDTLVGVIFSVYALVVVIASPIVGKILPLLRLRDVYLVGIAITGLANICFGMVSYLHDSDVFIVVCVSLRVLGALGAACFLTVIYALVPILFPNDMNTVNGTLETGIGLGMCVGPAVGVWLYSMGGFCLPFYGLGGFILLTVPVSYVAFPDYEIATRPGQSGGTTCVRRVLCRPGATLPLLILSSTAVCIASLYPTLQPHMSRLGVSVEGVGLIYLMLSAVYAVSTPLVGLATDRYGFPSGFMFGGLLLTALSYILIGNSPLLPRLPHDELYKQDVLGIVVLGLASAMCIVPTYGAILQATVSQGETADIATFSMVGGLWSAAYSLGEMLGPLYAGVITSYLSFATSTTFTALLPLALAVVLGAYMCSNRLYAKSSSH